MNSSIYWCDNCYVPILSKKCNNCGEISQKEMPTPLKPVFKEEYEMYKENIVTRDALSRDILPAVLFRSGQFLISELSAPANHFRIHILTGRETAGHSILRVKVIREQVERTFMKFENYPLEDDKYLNNLIDANKTHLERIEKEAKSFIEETVKKFPNHIAMSSFSGGKDSTVTAYLVKQVIGDHKVVFSNTGIEYPETIEYIKKFGDYFGELEFLEQKNDFDRLCGILGPPSRLMRWCCSTQKATPINIYQQTLRKPILSFDGIRREESALRQDYERVKDNTKMIQQVSAYPLLNWTEFDVWLYILWKKIPFNPLYREGYARVGCYPCPNNGSMDKYLMSHFHSELSDEWNTKLYNFIDSSKEEYLTDDWEGYDETWAEDSWKGRRVKYHNDIIGFSTAEEQFLEENNNLSKLEDVGDKPCTFDNSLVINLDEELPDNYIEFLKPFGKVSVKTLNGNKVVNLEGKKFKMLYSTKSNRISLKYGNTEVSSLLNLIFRQFNKSLNCFNCGSCVGSCPHGAIQLKPVFTIDESKCTHCLTCTGTKYLKFSCVALHYKPDRKLIRKGQKTNL